MKTVEWRDKETGLLWNGSIMKEKGADCIVQRADGEKVRMQKAELHEPGTTPPLEIDQPKETQQPQQVHPNVLLIQALKQGHPLDYKLGLQFMEFALRYAAVQLHIDWSDDVEAVFTPEQLQFCQNSIIGLENARIEEVLHRAIFGPGAVRVPKKEADQAEGEKAK